MKIIIIICLLPFFCSAQEGLRYDDTKFSIGLNIPFGVATYMYNVRGRWGGLISVVHAGGLGQNDDNYISPWHELTSEYIVNQRIISLGLMYRILGPFHLYGGIGVGWSTRQLVYKDTPPVVLEDAYRTIPEQFRPMAHGGLQLTIWRLAVGAGYNTYINGPEFFVGYVVKYNPGK